MCITGVDPTFLALVLLNALSEAISRYISISVHALLRLLVYLDIRSDMMGWTVSLPQIRFPAIVPESPEDGPASDNDL